MIQGQLIDNLTRIARHMSYVSIAREQECAAVHAVEPDEKCEFVMNTESCHESVKLFDSITFLYCEFTYKSTAFYFAFFLLVCTQIIEIYRVKLKKSFYFGRHY